jgi:GNAT superfamily N-acetyltransferase
MNKDINPSAQIYVAELWGKIVGFIGILHFPHAKIKNMKKITRVVVLPDYQGIGVGRVLMNFVANFYHKQGYRMTITTSHPAINKSMKPPWFLQRQGRTALIGKTGMKGFGKTVTTRRFTCSWEYKPQLLIK